MEWLTGIVPVVFVALLCPLMMWLMMRGMHSGHGGHNTQSISQTPSADADEVARLREEVVTLREQAGRRS
jgi:hypothetical protein